MQQPSVSFWAHGASTSEVANTPTDERPRLTPYLPDTSAPTTAIVVCPGGGYRMLAPHEGEPVARWLNGLGIAAFVLEYRHAPHRHPAPLRDAQRAVRLVRHYAGEWNVAPDRVGILGFSAGGHLAATVSTQPGDQQHLDEHGGDEGFAIPDDAETAIQTGFLLESSPERHRYLICGAIPGLRYDGRFHGQWLHVIVEYEEGTTPSIATAYRPDTARWINHRRRRED